MASPVIPARDRGCYVLAVPFHRPDELEDVDSDPFGLAVCYFLSSSIGEESYAAGVREPLTDEPTFCVDPIGMYASP